MRKITKINYMSHFAAMLIILLVIMILLNSCASKSGAKTQQVCGNKILEANEECDFTGCTSGKICNEKCKCETLLPPALPT